MRAWRGYVHFQPSLPGPWGTNCCVPDLLCSSSYLLFQSKLLILPVLSEVCFSFLSSALVLGCHKWPWNSVLSSSSSLSYLLEVQSSSSPPAGWWSLWSVFSCSSCCYMRAEFWYDGFHQPHHSWDVCVWAWRSSNAIYIQKGMHCTITH